jgi:hypothetical protein
MPNPNRWVYRQFLFRKRKKRSLIENRAIEVAGDHPPPVLFQLHPQPFRENLPKLPINLKALCLKSPTQRVTSINSIPKMQATREKHNRIKDHNHPSAAINSQTKGGQIQTETIIKLTAIEADTIIDPDPEIVRVTVIVTIHEAVGGDEVFQAQVVTMRIVAPGTIVVIVIEEDLQHLVMKIIENTKKPIATIVGCGVIAKFYC